MPTTKAPTTERGVVSNVPTSPSWAMFGSVAPDGDLEKSPKLKWPTSIRDTYPAMLNDAQVEALRAATTLPQKRRRWLIDPNGSEDRIVQHVATDLGLPVKGEDAKPRVVSPRRFAWGRHLHHVLLAPFMGHYFFSQFAPIGPDGLAHLRKLLPLPPRTLQEIRVADDGGLVYVRQMIGPRAKQGLIALPDPISVDRLVGYIWEQEAGNWTGRSMLRSVYRDWLAKDDLIRGNLTKMRRNGMGIPTAMQTEKGADPGALADAQKVAQAWRVGEESSAGLPYGTDIKLKGVEGTVPDAVPSIKMHDEAMARAFLAMFIQLGQTDTGARALGESFIDWFALRLDAIAEWVCETTTLHVIRDLVDWNYGEDVELIPLLVSERDEEPELAVADMVALIDAGALTVDNDLQDYLRARYRLPDRRTPEQGPIASRRRPTRAATAAEIRLPDRDLRRQPNDAEVRAAVDFAGIELAFEDNLAALIAHWLTEVRPAQLDELETQIRQAAGDVTVLAAISATPDGEAELTDRMVSAATDGIAGALEEAAHQGNQLPGIDPESLREILQPRATATAALLARALSEAAGRRAVALTSPVVTPAQVAIDTRGYIEGLSTTYLEDQFNGLLAQGINTGRRSVIEQATSVTVYASALLDTSTCSVCLEWDGHEFDSLLSAELQFPTGGNLGCLGGPRCRCTLVATYGESAPSVP